MANAIAPQGALAAGLGPAIRGYSQYLFDSALQPRSAPTPYYVPSHESANFGTRFQIAFHGYAIAAIGERCPAFRRRTALALGNLIDRLLEPAAWAYWTSRGDNLDPVGPHNVMFSGHLAQLIGLYERFANDGRYDRPFVLDDGAMSRHEHTHESVCKALSRQMTTNRSHGVTCEPGVIYVACNDHAAIALRLHATTHGSRLDRAVDDWMAFVRKSMVRKRAGVFQVAYLEPYGRAVPVSFRVMDAWSLAFLAPYDRDLFDDLYPRWRKTVPIRADEAWVPALWPNEQLEISDVALNTAFGFVAARSAGDVELATRFERFAERRLGLLSRPAGRACWSAKRRLMVSALFAYGAALDHDELPNMLDARPDGFFDRPEIVDIEGATVDTANWRADGGLLVVLTSARPTEARLTVRGLKSAEPAVAGGQLVPSESGHGSDQVIRLRFDDRAQISWPTVRVA